LKIKSRGLGNMQITQQIDTEDRIILHLMGRELKRSYFKELQRETRISPQSLTKAIKRLVEKGKLLELDGHIRLKSKTRHFRISVTYLYLGTPENITYVKGVKKERRDKAREFQNSITKHQKLMVRRKKNRLTNTDPLWKRGQIAKALVRIHMGEDEKIVLEDIGITKKSFDSGINRSPRLQTIIKLLKQYKNKELPFKKIPDYAIFIKRELMYPKYTRQKSYQWFRK